MKNALRAIAFIFHLSLFTYRISSAQNALPECAQEMLLAHLLGSDPQALQRHTDYESRMYQAMQAGYTVSGSRSNVLYTLPVVVHIVHNNGPENISDAQVQQGIVDLNEGFANIGYYDSTTGVNTQIQFCLAKRDPNGAMTTGITRNVSTLTDVDINSSDIALKNLNRWNPYCYVNIWLVRSICSSGSCAGIAGYAYFPSSMGTSVDGLVCRAGFFGSSKGNSTVHIHEMGHYLGLYHTFQGGCTNNNCLSDGDKVCDTPPDNSTASLSCGAIVNSCTTDAQSGFTTDQNDMMTDYMDYSNHQCKNDFTQGQKNRMLWTLANVRTALPGCHSCENPCANPTAASFTSSAQTITIGGSVNFTNTSSNSTSYTWFINGTQFSTSTNTTYLFNTAGVFVIKLRADNSDPNCFSEYLDTITVTCPVVAGFSESATQILPGQAVNFTNSSTGATTYQWVIDGAVQTTTTNFTHTFPSNGDYSVYLIASNGTCSDTSSIFNFIHVGNGCSAYFTHTPASPNACNPVTFIPDTSCKYANYHWTFCEYDSVSVPAVATYPTAAAGAPGPDGGFFLRDHSGNYHLFFGSYDGSVVDSTLWFRMDFGNSVANAPTIHRMMVHGIIDDGHHGFHIIEVDGVYYAFLLTRSNLWRARIGTDLNTDTLYATKVGGLTNAIGFGHEVEVVRETNNYWVIITNWSQDILVGYLGSNIANDVITYNRYKKGTGNENYFAHCYVKNKGKHYIFGCDPYGGLTRFDFGNSLGNTPTWTNLGLFGSGLIGDLTLFPNCDGSFDGYIYKENISDHKVIHLDSITAVPVIKATFPTTIPRLVRASNFLITEMGLTGFVGEYYSAQQQRLTFGNCNTNNAYSENRFPPPISYTTPGPRYVRLLVDQGFPTESSYCDVINVNAVNTPPLNLGPDTTMCAGNSIVLHAGPFYSTYYWTGGATDSVYSVAYPGVYSVTVSNYCGSTLTDSITVSVDSTHNISLSDTAICATKSILLSAPPGYSTYQWLPSTGVSCPTCMVTVATPAVTTIYTLQATTSKGCLVIANKTVTVTTCPGINDLGEGVFAVEIIPNPANNQITVSLGGWQADEVRVYSADGKLVAEVKQPQHNTLDISTLSKGVYVAEVKARNLVERVRWVKM